MALWFSNITELSKGILRTYTSRLKLKLLDLLEWKLSELSHFFKCVGILVTAVLLGLATNATTLLSTAEYAKTSIRGKKLLVDPTAKKGVGRRSKTIPIRKVKT